MDEGGHSQNMMVGGPIPKLRDLLPLGQWLTKSRSIAWGAGRIYMTIFDREEDVREVYPSVPPPFKFALPYGSTKMSSLVDANIILTENGRQIKPEPLSEYSIKDEEDLINRFVEPGDLVVVKCDLQFANTVNQYPSMYQLPQSIIDLFVTVDPITGEHKNSLESFVIPVLNLNVYLDIEGFLSLTSYDYEEALMDTKLWDRTDLGGFRQRDYVQKRSKFNLGTGPDLDLGRVSFYNFVWRNTDLVTMIPGIVETRKEKHWFIDNWNSNIYKSPKDIGREQFVKFPLVGVVGTLLEVRHVSHGLSKSGDYIGGNEYQTTFYKILFHDRIPLWVDAPVWKCPEPLRLPICLVIP